LTFVEETLDADQVKESTATQLDRVQRLRIGNDDPVLSEFPKITRQWECDRGRDGVAATDMRRSLAAPLLHQVLAAVHPSPNAHGAD
jgi:hypothetical protein